MSKNANCPSSEVCFVLLSSSEVLHEPRVFMGDVSVAAGCVISRIWKNIFYLLKYAVKLESNQNVMCN